MQLIEINDPPGKEINKMSTLSESRNAISDKENISDIISDSENNTHTKCSENLDFKETDSLCLNINGTIEIKGGDLDIKSNDDEPDDEYELKNNGQSNGTSSDIKHNLTETDSEQPRAILEEKENIINTNDIETIDKELNENDTLLANVTTQSLKNTQENISNNDITTDDCDSASSNNIAFSPKSDTEPSNINLPSASAEQELKDVALTEEAIPSSLTISSNLGKAEDSQLSKSTDSPVKDNNDGKSIELNQHIADVTINVEQNKEQNTDTHMNETGTNSVTNIPKKDNDMDIGATESKPSTNDISKSEDDLLDLEGDMITTDDDIDMSFENPIENDQEVNNINVRVEDKNIINQNMQDEVIETEKSSEETDKNAVNAVKLNDNMNIDDSMKSSSENAEESFNIFSECQDSIVNKQNNHAEPDKTLATKTESKHLNIELSNKESKEKMDVDESTLIATEDANESSNITSDDSLENIQNDKADSDKNKKENTESDNIWSSNTENVHTETTTREKQSEEAQKEEEDNVIMDIDDILEVSSKKVVTYTDVEKKSNNDDAKNEALPIKEDVVCITDKSEDKVTVEYSNSLETDNECTEVISLDEIDAEQEKPVISKSCEEQTAKIQEKPIQVCKLSNTLDILSDDEDEVPEKSDANKDTTQKAKVDDKCINLDDDDDIMLIEDTNSQESKTEPVLLKSDESDKNNSQDDINPDTTSEKPEVKSIEEIHTDEKTATEKIDSDVTKEKTKPTEPIEEVKPLITKTFLKSVTKNLAEMTRNELEDFCILKLVESVVDKSNLNEIKNRMKTMTQTLEDVRKKCMALTKQNRDLQVVVKTVQEDQKKRNSTPMMPMKITRSVGMQVVLNGEKSLSKVKMSVPSQPPPPMTPARPNRPSQSPKPQIKASPNIPVPRLVPASSPTVKSPVTQTNKPTPKIITPQRPEKRPHNKITSPASAVTVDLTDDEPPAKVVPKNPAPPVRVVPSQNLMPKNRPLFSPNKNNNNSNSQRKVYIPISSSPPVPRPNLPVVKSNFGPRPRAPVNSSVKTHTIRPITQVSMINRHPAPLPEVVKQYPHPGWKALPPAPDLKLSKVDNGIVISWKFDGHPADSHEEVASFQLYAYQETLAPPSTVLWKKIGDIKALPLPMACTLTQFMSGFKYYFAVRAIDVRSRIGPFSLPGSIMLISKS